MRLHPPRLGLPALGVAFMLAFAGCSQEPVQQSVTVGFVPDTKPAPPIRWVDATVPQGTMIHLTMLTALDAAANHPGDHFQARVSEGIVAGNLLAIHEGSIIDGFVAAVTPAPRGSKGRPAALSLGFKMVSTVTGAGAPLAARVSAPARGAAGGAITALKVGTPITIVLDEPVRIKVRQ